MTEGYSQEHRAAELEAALGLKMNQVKDAQKSTKFIDAKSITREVLLKVSLQQQAQSSTSRKRYMRCINMFHLTTHRNPVLPLQLPSILGLYLLPLPHHIVFAQGVRMCRKG